MPANCVAGNAFLDMTVLSKAVLDMTVLSLTGAWHVQTI